MGAYLMFSGADSKSFSERHQALKLSSVSAHAYLQTLYFQFSLARALIASDSLSCRFPLRSSGPPARNEEIYFVHVLIV